MMDSQSVFPARPNNIRKKGQNRWPDGTIQKYTIVDEICLPQTGAPTKLIYLQKIQFEDEVVELRLCYYIVGKLPRMKGKWVFGQYATFVPANDFKAIIDEAKRRGWI